MAPAGVRRAGVWRLWRGRQRISESDADALQWGRAIAERLVDFLFDRAKVDAYSWAEASFAHWIEQEAGALSAAFYLPVVGVGELPDLAVLAADAAYD